MELGFLEEVVPEDQGDCGAPYFSSKVGGKPSWPDLSCLPESLMCKGCNKPLSLLLQIHAPLDVQEAGESQNEKEDAEEDPRTLFLFMCTSSKCHAPGDCSPFLVLRYQGSDRSVDSDPNHSPPITETTPSTPSLCIVCGGRGSKYCGTCKVTNYCSKEHQLHDWRRGHKQACPDLATSSLSITSLKYKPWLGVGLPEWEVVTEAEPGVCPGGEEERSERERMKDYERYVQEHGNGKNLSVETLEKMAVGGAGGRAGGGVKEDKMFKAFMKRIAVERQQVLRYQHGGEPLFVSGKGVPLNSDIPKCPCGAQRQFELQVMPQLLYYLKLDSAPSEPGIDWGSLYVYTCPDTHCPRGRGYHTEFLWKQEMP